MIAWSQLRIEPDCTAKMRFSRFFGLAGKLTAFERLMLCIRLISTALIFAMGLVILLGPITAPSTFQMAKFGTRSSDITKGLFAVLKETIEVFGSTDVNNGVGLTTSEIFILTDYTASQIKNVPQYIVISLYGRCDIKYNTTMRQDPNGASYEVRNSSVVEVCFNTGPGFIFDYREVLLQLGLDIILVYAYDHEMSAPLGLLESYNEYMKTLKSLKANAVYLLISVLWLEIVIFILTVWYYKIKGKLINPLKERILTHVISFFSLAVFVMGLTGAITLAWLALTMKQKISSELKAFGFSYGLGLTWFSCLWIFTFFIVVSTLAWCGLEWCVSDVQRPYNDGSKNNILSYRAGVFTEANGTSVGNMSSGSDLYSSHLDTNVYIRDTTNADRDRAEEVELQDIALYSSGEDELNPGRTVKPSSTMYF